MDVAPDLATLLIPGGAVGAFVYLVIHLSKLSSGDRKDYQTMLHNLRKQHSLETEALSTQHKAELQDCRQQREKVETQLDETRDKLWKAQDAAARYRRQVEGGDVR